MCVCIYSENDQKLFLLCAGEGNYALLCTWFNEGLNAFFLYMVGLSTKGYWLLAAEISYYCTTSLYLPNSCVERLLSTERRRRSTRSPLLIGIESWLALLAISNFLILSAATPTKSLLKLAFTRLPVWGSWNLFLGYRSPSSYILDPFSSNFGKDTCRGPSFVLWFKSNLKLPPWRSGLPSVSQPSVLVSRGSRVPGRGDLIDGFMISSRCRRKSPLNLSVMWGTIYVRRLFVI